jgi:hypothetical protein
MYKCSPVQRSRKFPCFLSLPTGWFHSECLCRCLLPLLSFNAPHSISSAEQSKNSSSSESTMQRRNKSQCYHANTWLKWSMKNYG